MFKLRTVLPSGLNTHSDMLTRFVLTPPSGKNWDLSAALSDFEQLRQVHAGSLSYSLPEEREQALTEHKDMTRVGRPLLHRQDDVVQGEGSMHSDTPP